MMENKQIRVKVRFFAVLREALGMNESEREIPAGTTAGELITLLVEEYPVLSSYTQIVSVAVNQVHVGMQTRLHHGDEVAYLPPVGGG